MGLEQRVDKLEQSIGTQSGFGCDRCRDYSYLPDVVNTEDRYYSHPLCRSCGRKFTYCVRIINENAPGVRFLNGAPVKGEAMQVVDAISGDEPIQVHTFNIQPGAVIDDNSEVEQD